MTSFLWACCAACLLMALVGAHEEQQLDGELLVDGDAGSKEPRSDPANAESVAGTEDKALHHSDASRPLTSYARDVEIVRLEKELQTFRANELQPTAAALMAARAAHQEEAKRGGWFPSNDAKQRIQNLAQKVKDAERALAAAERRDIELLRRLKPLYGIISYQFMQEQKSAFGRSLSVVGDMAYRQTLFDALFDGGHADSLSELLVQLLLRYVMTYMLLYPFAALYFLLWTAPWGIYEYSSGGFFDAVVGVTVWLFATFCVLVPFFFAIYGVAYLAKRGVEERRTRQRQRAEDVQNRLRITAAQQKKDR